MLKINYMLEKDSIAKKQKEVLLLIELVGEKVKIVNKNAKKLNIGIAIDISQSMNETLIKKESMWLNIPHNIVPKSPWDTQPYFPNPILPQPTPYIDPFLSQPLPGIPSPSDINKYVDDYQKIIEQQKIKQQFTELTRTTNLSKLDQAKNVAIKAVQNMKNGDIVSITAFDNNISTVVNAVVINEHNKNDIIQKINSLKANGNTDLHGGWLASATEVAKNLSKKSINRVLVLTDGETNTGVRDPKQIVSNVAALYDKSITTTTFGIGNRFNEDLLQNMANAGNGNFYYASIDKELDDMFIEEFNGLSNIIASNIEINLNELNIKEVKQLNQFVEKENIIVLPNVISNNKQSLLLKLNLELNNIEKDLNIGKIKISYKDNQENLCNQTIEIKTNIVSKKEYENLPFNQEVKVQETLLVIANNKIMATQAIDNGDYLSAKNFLSGSIAYANSVNLNDERLKNEVASLNTTYHTADSTDVSSLRKSLSYQSYKTRFNKD